MSDMVPSERAFYEWLHVTPKFQSDHMLRTREVFIAGWDAACEFIRAGFPPEYDPDLAEAQRIAETYADGSAEHDRTENEEAGRG